jgi:hypothetical protein
VFDLFYEVFEAECRGHAEGAVLLLPELRTNIAATFQQCDVNEGSWPLLRVSLEVLDEFLAKQGGAAEVAPAGADGLGVAGEAACFISRLTEHLSQVQTDGGQIEEEDVLAILQAASVIMSAFAGDKNLAPELEKALETASVILTDQPPKSTGLEPVPGECGQAIRRKKLAEALA